MKINSLFVIFAVLFISVFWVTLGYGAQNKLEDYGLSEEAVKYLSAQEVQEILNSKTPQELREEAMKNNAFGGQDTTDLANNPQPLNSELYEGTVDCFDYYSFGSVQTNLTSKSLSFDSGTIINFEGTISNQNEYPIVDGSLYVKIIKQRSTIKDPNGPDVVDQFIAKDNIAIPAKSNIKVSFNWEIPSTLVEGEYKLASFFTVSKKFNLLGLSFTDDVLGNTYGFHVNGPKSNIQFDKAGVTINENPYFFAAFPPRVSVIDTALVSAKIINSTNVDEPVDVVWKLYKWDSIGPNNFIREVNEKHTIKANFYKDVQISIPEAKEPVYYVVGTLKYKDSKSIIGVRFVRPEIDKLRINFPSITGFPLEQWSKYSMFSCLYNSGTSGSVPGGKLTMTITDTNNKTIQEYTYQGPVTGEVMGVKKDFKLNQYLNHFFLTTTLWQSGEIVDQVKTEYDCKKIDSKLCKKGVILNISKPNFFIIVGAIGLLIILGSLFLLKNKNNV